MLRDNLETVLWGSSSHLAGPLAASGTLSLSECIEIKLTKSSMYNVLVMCSV